MHSTQCIGLPYLSIYLSRGGKCSGLLRGWEKGKPVLLIFTLFFCFYCERDGTRDTEREREREREIERDKCKENKTDLLRIEREREEKKKNNFTLVLFVLLLDHRDTLAAVAEYPVKTTTTKTTKTFTNSILTSCSLVSFSKS